jgi:hypothetical protein
MIEGWKRIDLGCCECRDFIDAWNHNTNIDKNSPALKLLIEN